MDEGKSALMLVTRNLRQTLWEIIVPPGYERLPGELAAVDALLDDPVFFQPYRARVSALAGRPSIPIETYLRMMFLTYRYRLGYETLCREVADSLCWMRFCRVPLGTRVPHPSTLEKITTRCGPGVIEQLNRALLVKADRAKVVKTERVRADTTVVEANVGCPTDSGLLVRAISRIVALVGHVHAAGAASRTTVRDRRRAARRRAHSVGAHLRLRTEEAKGAVLAVTGEPRRASPRRPRCWSTPAGTPAGRARRPAGGWPRPSASWTRSLAGPGGSWRRPAPGWPGCRWTRPPGWSACTTATPGRS